MKFRYYKSNDKWNSVVHDIKTKSSMYIKVWKRRYLLIREPPHRSHEPLPIPIRSKKTEKKKKKKIHNYIQF